MLPKLPPNWNNLLFHCHRSSRGNGSLSKFHMQIYSVKELINKLILLIYEFLKLTLSVFSNNNFDSKWWYMKVKRFYHNLMLLYWGIITVNEFLTERIPFFQYWIVVVWIVRIGVLLCMTRKRAKSFIQLDKFKVSK